MSNDGHMYTCTCAYELYSAHTYIKVSLDTIYIFIQYSIHYATSTIHSLVAVIIQQLILYS